MKTGRRGWDTISQSRHKPPPPRTALSPKETQTQSCSVRRIRTPIGHPQLLTPEGRAPKTPSFEKQWGKTHRLEHLEHRRLLGLTHTGSRWSMDGVAPELGVKGRLPVCKVQAWGADIYLAWHTFGAYRMLSGMETGGRHLHALSPPCSFQGHHLFFFLSPGFLSSPKYQYVLDESFDTWLPPWFLLLPATRDTSPWPGLDGQYGPKGL